MRLVFRTQDPTRLGTQEVTWYCGKQGVRVGAMEEGPELLLTARELGDTWSRETGAPSRSAAQGPASNAPGGGGVALRSGLLSRKR